MSTKQAPPGYERVWVAPHKSAGSLRAEAAARSGARTVLVERSWEGAEGI